jgi:hypothetical protein
MNGEQIREFLLEEVRPAVLGVYKPNSCVATVKVTIGVLKYLGVKARPFPCALLVANQAGARILVDGNDLTAEEVIQLRDAGAYAVEVAGTGAWDDVTGGWDGHMVTIADFDDGPWLLDLSLDQARRGAYKIDVTPTAHRVRSPHPAEAIVARVESCLVRWTPIICDDWRRHKDWKRDDLTKPIISHLIHHVRALVEEQPTCKDCGHALSDHEYDVGGNPVCMILPGEGPIGCRVCRSTHQALTAAVAARPV